MATAATTPLPALLTTPDRLGSLASELAAGLRPRGDVWRDYGVSTRADAEAVSSLPLFQQLLCEARAAWQSREALPLRVKAKAGALVEDALVFMHAGVLNPVQPLSQRVAAFTALAKMAGIEQPAETRVGFGGGVGVGGGVAISISMDLGGGNIVGVKVGGGGGGEEVVDAEADEEADGEFLLNPEDYMIAEAE